MALHCFNLFFPCTNILQVKYMHPSLHCTFKVAAKFATILRLGLDTGLRKYTSTARRGVCANNSRGPRNVTS